MKRLLLSAVLLAAIAPSAQAQGIAPGWTPTGEWQCGPVRIVTSDDGYGGMDFYVTGAWFNNHFTMQPRGRRFFYNGTPCLPVGKPLPYAWDPPPRQSKAEPREEPEPKCDVPGCDK